MLRQLACGVMTLALSGLATACSGTVTNVRLYHLGEADPGATPLGAGQNPTVDSVGGANATKIGLTYYAGSGGVGPPMGVGLAPGSSMSMQFSNVDSRYVADPVVGLTDNFGIEAYIEPVSVSQARPFYNGGDGTPLDSVNDGFGLYISSGHYAGAINGTVIPTSAVAIPFVPVEMALVCRAGVTTIYINDHQVGSSTLVPVSPTATDKLSIGNFDATASYPNFSGIVDEARIFTFAAPEDFDPGTDLGPAAVPEPAAGLAILLPLMIRRRKAA